MKSFVKNTERFTRKTVTLIVVLSLSLSVLSILTPIAPFTVQGSSYGSIYSQNGVPVVGAMVMASGPEGSGFATTGSSGQYSISEGLKTGTYTVSVVALGYLRAEEEEVAVTVGEQTPNVDFYLNLSGGISGKVSDATSGAGIENIRVMAVSSDGEYGWWGMTDSNGNYSISTNLATGTYNVTAFLPEGYVTEIISGVEVTAGSETTGVNLALERSGVISGTVTTTDGDPLANATVMTMSDDGQYYGFTTTDVSGKYSISSGLGTGTYTVYATYDTSYSTPVSNVEVTEGEETSGVDLTIAVSPPLPSGAISGKVTDTHGNPIQGASVTASGPAGSGCAITDENGDYLISEGLGTGTYTVEATAAGFESQNMTGVEVEVEKETENIDFQLERIPAEESGTISGTVLGEVREDVEPNNSFDQAELTTAGTHTGSLDSDTDPDDYYKIVVYAGQTLSVTATPASTLAINLYLYNQDRSEVSWEWGGEGQMLEASWTTNSEEPNYTYYIRLEVYSYGDYTFDVTLTSQNDAESGGDAGDNLDNPTSIDVGTYSGFLKDDDEKDCYKVIKNVTAGQGIYVKVTPATSLAVDLYLYDQDKAEQDWDWGAESEIVEVSARAEETGQFYFEVEAGSYGTYTMTVSIEPSLDVPVQEPSTPDDMEDVIVSVNATAVQNGIDRVILSYSTDEGVTWTNDTMIHNTTTKLYQGVIPGLEAGTEVSYKITVYDEAGDYFVQDKAGEYYIYTVVPEFPLVMILTLLMMFTLIAVVINLKRKQKT